MYAAQIKTGSGYYDILLLHTRFVHKNCAKDYGTTLQQQFLCALSLSLILARTHSCFSSPTLTVAYEWWASFNLCLWLQHLQHINVCRAVLVGTGTVPQRVCRCECVCVCASMCVCVFVRVSCFCLYTRAALDMSLGLFALKFNAREQRRDEAKSTPKWDGTRSSLAWLAPIAIVMRVHESIAREILEQLTLSYVLANGNQLSQAAPNDPRSVDRERKRERQAAVYLCVCGHSRPNYGKHTTAAQFPQSITFYPPPHPPSIMLHKLYKLREELRANIED